MAQLIDVLGEFFRAFSYAATQPGVLEGTTGRGHPIPLLLEKDTRRLAVATWPHKDSLGTTFLQEFIDAVKDTGCDGGLVVCLGSVPERLHALAGKERVNLWDGRRICQELGGAVLRETCPDVWTQNDPWRAPRPSQILEQLHQTVLETAVEAPPEAPPALETAEAEPPFPAAMAPMLAAPQTQPAAALELPLPFLEVAAPTPAPAAAPPPPPLVPERPSKPILRLQVTRALAASLAKPKTRTVERLFLRLVPHHIFEYEASLLVEGTIKSETQSGRIAVDAVSKRVSAWTRATDTATLPADVGDIDERPVRVGEADALKLVQAELRTLVTRDVLQEEDDNDWSVVVKKKVELAPDALRIHPLGVHWVPIWRVTGKEGSLEIDGATGEIVHEEVTTQRSDALLL